MYIVHKNMCTIKVYNLLESMCKIIHIVLEYYIWRDKRVSNSTKCAIHNPRFSLFKDHIQGPLFIEFNSKIKLADQLI